MEPAPIQNGAVRPRGRKRHALYLLRLIAIAAFALAGWIALAALTDSASASEPAPTDHRATPAQSGSTIRPTGIDPASARSADAPRAGAPSAGSIGASPAGVGSAGARPVDARAVIDAASRSVGERPVREAGTWGRELPGRVREIRERPVHFLQGRRHEVFDRKDRAVRHVRELADAAGLPRVRIADVRSDVPIVDGLVREIADARPVPAKDLPTGAEEQSAPGDETEAAREVPDGAAAAQNAQPSPASSTRDEEPGHCAGCQAGQRGPGPVAPSGKDAPRASGGHSFAPVADLRHGLHAVAPATVEASTFHRTALTDVSAPGGPSVVPD